MTTLRIAPPPDPNATTQQYENALKELEAKLKAKLICPRRIPPKRQKKRKKRKKKLWTSEDAWKVKVAGRTFDLKNLKNSAKSF